VVACKLTKDNTLLVESLYNQNFSPITIDTNNLSISTSEQSYVLDQGIFTCRFKRDIKNDMNPDKIFDLNNEYFAFLATGPLAPNGI
jgi:hypothetical protein